MMASLHTSHTSDEQARPDQTRVEGTGSQAHAAGDASREVLLQQTTARMPAFFRVLKLLAKRLAAEYAPQVARIGEGQFRALHVLYEDGDLQVGELAGRCGVAVPTMSKMLRSLEGNSLVVRTIDSENRRVVWVRLTPEGRALFDEISARFEHSLAQLLQGLTSEQLLDVLRTVDHFEALAGTDGPRADSAGASEHRRDMQDMSAASGEAGTRAIH